jgi:hypothetical protein
MDEDTAREVWNIMVTAGAYAFNAAHSYAYGKLGVWTMWLKKKYPAPFFARGLAHLPAGTDNERHDALLRDTAAFGRDIAVLPPDANARMTWRPVGDKTIVAGWTQIKGIGDKMGEKIVEFLEDGGTDLLEVDGIGPKKVETIQEFAHKEDPFGIYRLQRALSGAQSVCKAESLPEPTHTAQQAMTTAERGTMRLLVVPTHRNLRELFEVHRARTGEDLDPATVKDPDNSEWVLMPSQDVSGQIQLIFTRKKYPKFKKALWDIKLNHDVVLVEGYKMGGGKNDSKKSWGDSSGIFHVNKLWVIDPED